jgi:hypothetical protein
MNESQPMEGRLEAWRLWVIYGLVGIFIPVLCIPLV